MIYIYYIHNFDIFLASQFAGMCSYFPQQYTRHYSSCSRPVSLEGSVITTVVDRCYRQETECNTLDLILIRKAYTSRGRTGTYTSLQDKEIYKVCKITSCNCESESVRI